jgi:hypothetical protein
MPVAVARRAPATSIELAAVSSHSNALPSRGEREKRTQRGLKPVATVLGGSTMVWRSVITSRTSVRVLS